MLKAVGKTTVVSVEANVMVAGEPCYQLVLAPKDDRSLIGKVTIAIDGKYGVPLRFQVFAKGAASPAFQFGYTALQFTAPAAANFDFTPPSGASLTVENLTGDGQKSAAGQQSGTSGFGVYGKSWLTVAEVPQADLLKGFGTVPGSSGAAPVNGGSGPGSVLGGDSQAVLNSPARGGQAGARVVGERHPAHHQPVLDADDRRRGLHRGGRAERPLLSRGPRILMTTVLDSPELAIASSGLTKRFRGGQLAVDRLDLAVPRGAVYGFLGPNGSGKTTTIRMLLGLAFPTSGSARVLGVDMPDGAVRVLSRVGSLVEGPAFYPYLSGWDNLARYDAADGSVSAGTAKARIGTALDRVGLTAAAKKKFRNYSLGMKQRLAIAAALLTPRDLIVLDEPTNGLDPQGTREVRSLVRPIAADGIPVFVSSPLLAEVEQVSTHVGVMRTGRLVFQGELAALRRTAAPRVAVRTPDLTAAAEVLKKLGLADPVAADDAITAELGDVQPEQVTAELVHAGVAVRALAVESPSLEDLFVGLTGEGFDVER